MPMASESMYVPINDLKITRTNARKEHTVDKALLASIASIGLLYPLVVDAIEDGKWDVVDGAQRLLAIREGLKLGILENDAWALIDCRIRENGAADVQSLEVSLHANLRTPMHPLDECEAILRLTKEGEAKEAIALRFGQHERWLEQRVKLAQLAPEVKEVFREGKIGLGAAMAFTLGSADQQKAFLKRYKKLDVNTGQIHAAMTEQKVSARAANFELALYPEKSIQRDLFADPADPLGGIWLLDRKKFIELQDAWAADKIEQLKQLGYDDVRVLPRDDWQTLQGFVEFEGKVRTPEQRAKLTVFLKADHHGHIEVHENMVSRKAVEKAKVKKAKNGAAADSTEDEPKPMKCTEWSPAQHEIVNGLAAAALFNQVSAGKAPETLMQYLVIAQQFYGGGWMGNNNALAFEHNGSRMRWKRLAEAYESEAFVADDEAHDKALRSRLSYDEFCELSKPNREKLFSHAVASMIFPPPPTTVLKKNLPELAKLDWLKPGKDFFKRFRTDQLIDYRKRSGDKEAGHTPKKKEAHVLDCVVAADGASAFGFGLVK
jgi:ParB-like chromosome segregation protein Spo0J